MHTIQSYGGIISLNYLHPLTFLATSAQGEFPVKDTTRFSTTHTFTPAKGTRGLALFRTKDDIYFCVSWFWKSGILCITGQRNRFSPNHLNEYQLDSAHGLSTVIDEVVYCSRTRKTDDVRKYFLASTRKLLEYLDQKISKDQLIKHARGLVQNA